MKPQIDPAHLSRLANIPLDGSSAATVTTAANGFLEHVARIGQLSLDDLEPTNQVTNKTNELRLDQVKPSLSQDLALANAPATYQGYFVVPAVIEPT